MRIDWLRPAAQLKTPLDNLLECDANGSCLSPTIPDGAQLFVDPLLEPRSGDYVLLKMPTPIDGTGIDECVKRLLLVEEANGTRVWVIQNSAGMFRLVDEKIIGVVVASAVTHPGRTSQHGHLVDAAHRQCIENIARMRA